MTAEKVAMLKRKKKITEFLESPLLLEQYEA
jgi:hypothetical protein